MFALPGMTRLRANVPRARATALVLPRGCLGHLLFCPASAVRGSASGERGRRRSGFTLLELLIVVGIIATLLVLMAPAFTYIKGGTDVTSAAYNIGGLLEQARTYAMANKTYVWVGFKEENASNPSSPNSDMPAVGRVIVSIVASKDGTRGYDATNNSLPNPAWTNYNNSANLVAVTKLQHFENVHLAESLPPPDTGPMARPSVGPFYIIGNASCSSVTPFDWPLGSSLNAGQYSFQKVVNFDPQGVARIQYSTNTDGIVTYMEVGIQQTHGTSVSSGPNVAALQIDCMTGSVRKYRP